MGSTRGGPGRGQGRKPIGRERAIARSVTIAPDDLSYLLSIDNNLSAAIRRVVAEHRAQRQPDATSVDDL